MKKIRKASALALCAAMLLTSGACGGDGGRNPADTTTGTSSNVTTKDPNADIDITIDYDDMANIDGVDKENEEGAGELWESGKTAGNIKVLSFFDYHAIAPEKDIAELFAERFGGTLETEVVSSLEVSNRLGTLMAAGQSPDIMRYAPEYFPSYYIQNRFTALDEWLDMDSAVWSDMKDIIEQYGYGGKHYYFPYALTTTQYGITYNAAELEEIGIKDPMDLYFEGTWTWNEFEDVCLKWMDSNPDKAPISWPGALGVQLAATTGTPVIEFKDNQIINNMKDANVVRTMEFIEKLTREGCFWEGWHGPDGLESWLGTLFFIMPLDWAHPCGQEIFFKNQLDGEIRTVPMPRDPNSDTYYMSGATSGYVVPAGAQNVQGAAAFILASRLWATDPDVVNAEREERLYDGGYFYIKCNECKYKFESERDDVDAVCPECNTPRIPKFKMTYTERQQQIFDDILDPSKFTFVFSSNYGFGADMNQYITDVVDGTITTGESYTYLLEEYYNTIETTLNQYRDEIQKTE